jgi:nitrogenase molybdenum-iron protein beta chain
MIPKYVITGTLKEEFTRRVEALFELHQWIKNERVDLMIGTTYGKQIARAEDIPFVRAGFPVIDRYGGPLLPIVGYNGGIHLVEKISNALLDRFDRDVADEDFEIVL